MTSSNSVGIGAEDLRRFSADVMAGAGLDTNDAATVADCVLFAEMRGLSSHGVSRLPIYVERLSAGLVNAHPLLTYVRENKAMAVLDADNGSGPVAATKAMQKAMELAENYGIGTTVVRNSNHCGAMAYYTQMAAENGQIGIASTNSNSNMPPWGGKEKLLGTNPLSIGAPTGSEVPYILDMATSAVARGKIIVSAKTGKPIPEGWALDADGKPTQDAQVALDGMLLPMAGPKGSGLAIAIDIVSGVLAGAGFGKHIGPLYNNSDRTQNVGHFFTVINIDHFMDMDEFLSGMQQMITDIKGIPKADGVEEILLPGEPESRIIRRSRSEGITLPIEVYQELVELAGQVGVEVNMATTA